MEIKSALLKRLPETAKKCGPFAKKCITTAAPFVPPIMNTMGLGMDTKEIVASATFLEGVKIVGSRFASACTPPNLYYGGTCIMFVSGAFATITSGGNLILLTGTLTAARAIIRTTIKVVK